MMWMPAGLVAVVPAAVAAAGAATNGFDPWQIIGYGVTPAAVVALVLTGQLVPKRDHDRAISDLGLARQELADERAQQAIVQASIVDRVIPAVTRQTLVLEQIAPMLQTETHVRRRPTGG